MKKLSFACVSLFLLFAIPVFAQEIVADFSAVIKINPDSSLDITETISYDFGAEQRHGIYRDIPYKYQARGGNYNLRLDVISVTDAGGAKYEYQISGQGNNKRIKIGGADSLVSGQKTYVINYSVRRAINYFPDHDELYWNVIGNGWQVPIKQAKAEVYLPAAISENSLEYDCFIGEAGSGKKCVSERLNYDSAGRVDQVVYISDRLNAEDGFTIVAGLPKGSISQPSIFENILATVSDNIILFLPGLVFALMYYLWRQHGRDPRGRGTIIAEYDVPDNLTPAEAGTIIDEKADQVDVSAEIIYLATKGYLKIKKIAAAGVFKTDDYELAKLKDASGLSNEFDKQLMDSLFSAAVDTVKISSLKNKFYKDLLKIKKSLYESVTEKHYFAKRPDKVRAIYLTAAVATIFGSFFLGSLISFLSAIAIGLSGLAVLAFSFFMPARTKAGVVTKEHILGLKEYMTVAEKDRIKFHAAPEAITVLGAEPQKTPAYFEKLLPFAMVLGVEKAWAKQFENIYSQQPEWYSDPSDGNFTAIALVNGLGGFEAKANSVLASAPSSAAGGGSGFSGGGAGGGFGGGGGGSW
jgi:uncharacterized membrane protein